MGKGCAGSCLRRNDERGGAGMTEGVRGDDGVERGFLPAQE